MKSLFLAVALFLVPMSAMADWNGTPIHLADVEHTPIKITFYQYGQEKAVNYTIVPSASTLDIELDSHLGTGALVRVSVVSPNLSISTAMIGIRDIPFKDSACFKLSSDSACEAEWPTSIEIADVGPTASCFELPRKE